MKNLKIKLTTALVVATSIIGTFIAYVAIMSAIYVIFENLL